MGTHKHTRTHTHTHTTTAQALAHTQNPTSHTRAPTALFHAMTSGVEGLRVRDSEPPQKLHSLGGQQRHFDMPVGQALHSPLLPLLSSPLPAGTPVSGESSLLAARPRPALCDADPFLRGCVHSANVHGAGVSQRSLHLWRY